MTEDTVQVYVRLITGPSQSLLAHALGHSDRRHLPHLGGYPKQRVLPRPGIKVNSPPGHTKYGTPIEVLEIGTTGVDDELLNDFINEQRTTTK